MLVGLPFLNDPDALIKKFAKDPNSKVRSFFHFLNGKFQGYFLIKKKETCKTTKSISCLSIQIKSYSEILHVE